MSSKAENDSLNAELAAIGKRFAEEPAAVRAEVAAKLEEKGFEAGDAAELVSILGQPRHAHFFNNYVMAELHGSELPAECVWGRSDPARARQTHAPHTHTHPLAARGRPRATAASRSFRSFFLGPSRCGCT